MNHVQKLYMVKSGARIKKLMRALKSLRKKHGIISHNGRLQAPGWDSEILKRIYRSEVRTPERLRMLRSSQGLPMNNRPVSGTVRAHYDKYLEESRDIRHRLYQAGLASDRRYNVSQGRPAAFRKIFGGGSPHGRQISNMQDLYFANFLQPPGRPRYIEDALTYRFANQI